MLCKVLIFSINKVKLTSILCLHLIIKTVLHLVKRFGMHCLATAHQLNNLNIFFKDCLDDSDNTNSKLWSVYLDSIVDSLKDGLKYI